jgi:hypothetical protein
MAPPRSSALRLVSIWLAYLGLAVLATWPLALRAGTHLFGQGTPPLNVWAMGWVLHQLPRDPIHLFDGNVFYPYRYALAFSEHLFVPSLQAAPVVWLTGNLVLAHNVVVLLTLATAGLGMYLLAREVAGDGAGAFAAGVLYAFHTWNVNEIIRLQILSNQWFPFVLLGLLRFFKRPGWRPALWTAAAYAAQSLSCMYWSLYAPLLVGPAALVLAWRRRTPIRDLVPLVVAFVPAIVLTGLFAWPYVANGRTLGFARAVPDSVGIDRYFDVLPGNLLYERFLGTANSNMDAAHFLGFTAMALAMVGAGWGRFREGESRWPWIALALCGLALGLGPRVLAWGHDLGPGPYTLLYRYLPGFHGVRYPERFALFAVLGLGPLMAAGLARIPALATRAGGIAIGLVLFLEHLSIPLPLVPIATGDAIPSAHRWLRTQDDVRVVAEVPSAQYLMERLDATPMYLSTAHWKRTVQGFTGYFPPAYHYARWRLFHFPEPESVRFLERFGVDTIVVNPGGPRAWPAWDPSWRPTAFPEGQVVLRLPNASDGPSFDAPAPTVLPEVERGHWSVQGSHPGARLAIDGDPATAWGTGLAAQQRGDFYRIGFDRPTTVARISLSVARGEDFAVGLRLLGEDPERGWEEIPFDEPAAYDRLVALLLHRPRDAALELDLTPPRVLKGLRLRVEETDAFVMPWNVPELRVYRPKP